MNDEPGAVDGPCARVDQIAVEVDLDQVRCGDLAVPEAEGIDEEVPPRAGHAQRDVVEDHLGPAEHVENTIARRQLDAGIPLLAGHLRLALGDESRR